MKILCFVVVAASDPDKTVGDLESKVKLARTRRRGTEIKNRDVESCLLNIAANVHVDGAALFV